MNKFSRRDVLGSALSAAAVTGLSLPVGFSRTTQALEIPRLVPAPYPSPPGELSFEESEALWQIARAAGALYGMTSLRRDTFDAVVNLKSRGRPSHRMEYRSAVALLGPHRTSDSTRAWVEHILQGKEKSPKALHVARFVLWPFLALHLRDGGYEAFGCKTYPGVMGAGYRLSPLQPGVGG